MTGPKEYAAPRDPLEWAKKLVDARAWVLHSATGTVGRVARLYDGEGDLYVSPLNKQPVRAPVLELESGASHVAEPSSFVQLDDASRDLVTAAIGVVSAALSTVIQEAASSRRVPAPTAYFLMAAVLRMQAAQCDRARANEVAEMVERLAPKPSG